MTVPHLSHSCLFVGFALVSVAVALALVYCRPTGRVLLWMGAQDSDPYYTCKICLLMYPWTVLGVSQDASLQEIRTAYRSLSRYAAGQLLAARHGAARWMHLEE